MNWIIQTHKLTKTFKGNEVVSGLSMQVKRGEIYGFLGPNGAGKTTVLKLFSGLLKPTAGEIELFGEKTSSSSREFLKRMGILIEYPVFYEQLTARENLELHLRYMGDHDPGAIRRALGLVHLAEAGVKTVSSFSLGMKQRLGIARAISTKPELLLLDEPINGLDPLGIAEVRELFKTLSREYGVTILLSSHLLAEIELVADTIGVIDKGKLLEQVPMARIREREAQYIEVQTDDAQKTAVILTEELSIANFKILDQNIIRVYDLGHTQTEITRELIQRNVSILAISRKTGTLESHFLSLVNGGDIDA